MTNKPNIFVFWSKDGKPLTAGHLLCFECLKKNNENDFNVILVNEDNANLYGDVLPNWLDQKDVVKRSDYLRTEIICKSGGIWLDIDNLIMKSLKGIWEIILKDPDNVFVHGDAFFGSLPKTPFMQSARSIMHSIYLSGRQNLISKTFREVRRRNPKWKHHQYEHKEDVYIYGEPNNFIKNFDDVLMVIFFFTHREKYKKIWNAASPFDLKTKEEILDSKEPFAEFFKRSLKKIILTF